MVTAVPVAMGDPPATVFPVAQIGGGAGGRHRNSAREGTIAAQQEVRDGLVGLLPRLWRYGLVLSRSRDTAEDLVQATCVRAIERASQFGEGTRLDRWLFAIMHSIWIDQVRSRRIRAGHGFVEADEVLASDGQGEMEGRVLANQVLRKVDSLPEAQRVTVLLAYVEGLSYRETAEVLRIPIGTVMSRLAGARAQLAGMAEAQPPPAQWSKGQWSKGS